jgi:phosphatidylserine/phosphatidylglycerophosphate/cardiolipin synthase-like enzyme
MLFQTLRRLFQLITFVTVMYGSLVIYVTSTPVLDLNKPLSVYSSKVSKNKLLVEYIATANHSLECFIYNLTDQLIIDLLNEKALEGVSIDISTDKKNKKKLKKKLDPSIRIHTPKKSGLMHEKIIHVDEQWIYISTGNATLESQVVDENVSIVYNPGWCKEKGMKLTLLQLPSQRSDAKAMIIDAIDNAEKSIKMRMFYLTYKPIVNALIKAYKRGVHISIACDKKTSRFTTPLFKESNINLSYVDELGWLHAKMGLIDQRIFFMGSLNWTTSGFKSNQENLLYVDVDTVDAKSRQNIIDLFSDDKIR